MMREREVEEIPREQCDDCIGGKSLLPPSSSSSSFFRASRNSEITPPFLGSFCSSCFMRWNIIREILF